MKEMINLKKIVTVVVLLIIAGSAIFFIHKHQQEKRYPLSALARSSVAAVGATEAQFENKFVSITGPITSGESLWDGEYIKQLPYAVIYRKSEMYSWVETKEEKNGTTTYEYHKEWVEKPTSAVFFNNFKDHYNPPRKLISSILLVSTSTSINGYHVDLTRIQLGSMPGIKLSQDTVIPQKDVEIANDTYLYKRFEGNGTYENPGIGDVRVSYIGLPIGATTTAFGKIAGNTLVPYTYGNKTIYSLYFGSREDGLQAIDSQ